MKGFIPNFHYMDLSKQYTILLRTGKTAKMSLHELFARSPKTILYFYPKDMTPGCTLEAQDFTRRRSDFEKLGIEIIGVSLDSTESHTEFVSTCGLGIDLISDTDKSLHEAFSTIGEKKNYGKTYIGTIRSTFLLDSTGKILQEWRNVQATGHAEKVFTALSTH